MSDARLSELFSQLRHVRAVREKLGKTSARVAVLSGMASELAVATQQCSDQLEQVDSWLELVEGMLTDSVIDAGGSPDDGS